MKIGFLGGSFNPPHFGHIELATLAKRHLNLDLIIFLITPCNPFKSKIGLPSVGERKKMLEKIVKNRYFKMSSIETKFKVAQSFKTVRLVKNLYKNHELFFIFGSDNLLHFHKWQNHQEILQSVNVVFVNRGGFNHYKTLTQSHISKHSFQFIHTKTQEISSSAIRNNLNKTHD